MNVSNIIDGKKITLSFPSKFDRTELSNVIIIQKLFEDNIFTKTKIAKAKRLLKLPKKMDDTYAVILIIFVLQPNDARCAQDFVMPEALAEKLLRDLREIGYLSPSKDDDMFFDSKCMWYRLSKNCFESLIENGNLSGKTSANLSIPARISISNKYLIHTDKITKIKLFYNSDLDKDLIKIRDIFDKENLKNIQKRILEENQHAGICISFYGPSGVGKTEKVLQLAKDSGRDVYNFRIADTETKYCGEQQEMINEMFREFETIRKAYVNKNLADPILLINEADSLFARRHDDIDEMGTANRENNKLQAELLDHIENFDGILIVTTNKIQNFDDAMERRFLFKIKFDKPNKAVQSLIWKDRFPELSDDEIRNIVDKYSFTGGNINNVKKKVHIDYIISGQKSGINEIMDICKNEKIKTDKDKVIGF